MLTQIHEEYHEDVEDTDRQDLESGHSGSQRARAWRRGTTERGYLEPLFGSVTKMNIVPLHRGSKNPRCQALGPGYSDSQRSLEWKRTATARGCPVPLS